VLAEDTPQVGSQRARKFLESYRAHRSLNRAFYRRLQAEQLDYRALDHAGRSVDTPRESLVHQLYVTRNYAYSVRTGVLRWGADREALLVIPAALTSFDKTRLLIELERVEHELLDVLSYADIETRQVDVPWSAEPIDALTLLERLNTHEVLHTSWNLELMQQLRIGREPSPEGTASRPAAQST
jgi:uncharacterized damage-inducible protein DinB